MRFICPLDIWNFNARAILQQAWAIESGGWFAMENDFSGYFKLYFYNFLQPSYLN